MRKISIVFPGQGSQSVGMGKEFYNNFEEVRLYYEKAEKIVGYDIKKVIFEGTQEQLSQTEYTQPSVFLTSYITFIALKTRLPNILEKVSYVAGHSLGEYTAVCVSEALDFEQTLNTVKTRAKIMSEVGKKNPGGMIAVLGIPKEQLQQYCNTIKQQGYTVEPVNFNTPQQIVVAGEIKGIEELQVLLNQNKVKSIKLNVSGAFHSSLMNEAQKIFSQTLDKLNINNAIIPIVMNYDASPHTNKKEIIENLKLQINHPVLWEDSIKFMYENGVDTFIECGPGKVLSGMIKKIVPEVKVFTTDNLDNFNSTIDNLK